jgi:hypothetical protein
MSASTVSLPVPPPGFSPAAALPRWPKRHRGSHPEAGQLVISMDAKKNVVGNLKNPGIG